MRNIFLSDLFDIDEPYFAENLYRDTQKIADEVKSRLKMRQKQP
jgi:hypothetical protein